MEKRKYLYDILLFIFPMDVDVLQKPDQLGNISMLATYVCSLKHFCDSAFKSGIVIASDFRSLRYVQLNA